MNREEVECMTNFELRSAIAKLKGMTNLIPAYLPNWPSDVTDAWGLMEEMRKDKHCIPQIYQVDDDTFWRVAWRIAGDQCFDGTKDESAPRAICKMFLMWKTR